MEAEKPLWEPQPELVDWHIAPVRIPKEIRDEILSVCQKRGCSLVEFVLIATMAGVGYTDDAVRATARICYPPRNIERKS